MLTSTHSLVGASAGKYIPNPFLAFLAGVFLHFVFDKIPHFWSLNKKFEGLMLALDTVGTILIIIVLFFSHLPNKSGIVGGALGGAGVDLFLVLVPVTNKNKTARWHSARQTHLRQARFILNDLVIAVAAIIILIFFP